LEETKTILENCTGSIARQHMKGIITNDPIQMLRGARERGKGHPPVVKTAGLLPIWAGTTEETRRGKKLLAQKGYEDLRILFVGAGRFSEAKRGGKECLASKRKTQKSVGETGIVTQEKEKKGRKTV